ncbi:MAG: DUF4065 domain-containing protein [Clostridium sp.]|nr:DUF4065 domain-containing protein [Clostridium sp.]
MESKQVRCFECGAKDDYFMKKEIRKYEGDGYKFELEVEVPYCSKCKESLVIESVEDAIAQRANEIIRKQRGIITRPEIEVILSKYAVSQKYLSKLLGWGEITLTRYISGGYTPSKENSDKLKAIMNPYVFLNLLNMREEETAGMITRETAYLKAQTRVNEEIERLEEENGKIYEVVDWFLSQATVDNPITHLALQKLLYFVQGWSKILLGKWMFEQDCVAWVHGAVFRTVYNEFKYFTYKPLPRVNNQSRLSNEEIALLDVIKRYYFDVYSGRMLENICHKESPYMDIWKNNYGSNTSSNIIPKEQIEQYYKKIANEYHITKEDLSGIRKYLFTMASL